ncbi:MAG TPA: hypothetical protein VMR62_14940 [Bryobacteraceae bacterium]|nr:hypothetical protein [Bryobacteraceae bacterium]
MAGAIFAISATSRPDLSDLVPIRNSAENYFILNWPALLRDHPHALIAGSSLFFGAPVQALGYMVEGDHAIVEGEWVLDFVLLPDSGNLLHPAHRFGDQMITVHLAPGAHVQFSGRALVWVRGTFRVFSGDPAGSKPLYALEQAQVEPAERREIDKYFK